MVEQNGRQLVDLIKQITTIIMRDNEWWNQNQAVDTLRKSKTQIFS